MSRETSSRLQDILEAIDSCLKYTQYLSNVEIGGMAMDAALRNLAIIGEAVNHLPTEVTDRDPDTDWSAIVGLRNFLVHQYFAIDENEILKILDKYLKPLKETVTALLDELETNR